MSESTFVYVKNMVCDRCIRVVREELTKLGLDVCHVELGRVELKTAVRKISFDAIRRVLKENGFELLEDKKAKLIEAIKHKIIHLVHHSDEVHSININYSEYLSNELAVEYHYLSNLFSSVENITIEQFIILQKIERAKELLKYNEDTLSEIAYRMGYSSLQHLSSQFKKVTGMTASQFRNMTSNVRKPLDKIH